MDIVRRANETNRRWERMEFLDDSSADAAVYGATVHRLDAAVERWGATGIEVVVANGEPFDRMAIRQRIAAAGVRMATVVDPAAVISPTARLSPGAVVFPGCFVSSGATIGENSVLIAGALLGHHARLGEDCIVAGQVNIGGGCEIGNQTYIGMGVQVREKVRVGAGTIVGMGSVVFADIPDEVVALGNPCRPMQRNSARRVFA